MKQRQTFNFNQVLNKVKKETGIAEKNATNPHEIVDIITFCSRRDLLGLPYMSPPMILSITQTIILKCFYASSKYNEDLTLSQEEREWLEAWAEEQDLEKKLIIKDVLSKHANKNIIKELILVLGRRSGKTTLASVIATYEGYKCIQLGNPQEYFGLVPDNPILILNIATAAPQAKLLYNEIKARLRYSPYFKDIVNQDKSNSEYTYLLTPQDKETNERLIEEGRTKELIPGSIVIQCGHSNSNSLMGSGVICLIFDELAYFNDGAGKSGGEKVVGDLIPNTMAFKHPNGEAAGKVVQISAPSGKSGIFYNNYRNAFTGGEAAKSSMAFQFPTWDVNPNMQREDFDKEYKKNETEARMRYGAEFSGTLSTLFFPTDIIDECVDFNLYQVEKGSRNIRYYLHVDPALSNHNYALVLLHQDSFMNRETGGHDRKIFIDHVKVWNPHKLGEIQISEVEKYIIDLNKRFNIVSITYDAFNSASSLQNFRKKSLPASRTPFRSSYKQLIYTELRDLVIGRNIYLPPNEELIGEFKGLKCAMAAKGFRIFPDPDSAYPTDDILDCIAGAAHMALEVIIQGLPKTTTINNPWGNSGRLQSLFGSSPNVRYGKE